MGDEYEDYRNDWDDDERNAAGGFRNKRRRVLTPWRPAPAPPPHVVYTQAPPPPPPPPAPRSVLGDISLGTTVQIVALGYAAVTPLPPKPAVTGEARTDATNLVAYQEALAQHAKRAQQISTIGMVAGVLLQGRRL